MSDDGVSRRNLLRAGAAAAGALAVTGSGADAAARTIHGEMPWAPGEADSPTPVETGPYSFFTEEEAGFIDAALDRLIPEDAHGPGARALGGTLFLDRQLAGSYGEAQLYRAGIKAVDDHCRGTLGGKRFLELPPDQQDAILSGMEEGKLELQGVDGKTFFDQLLQNTIESFFADPLYGGNKEMAAWKMIGFPGARYDYRDWVARHGEHYPLPPVALNGRAGWRAKKA